MYTFTLVHKSFDLMHFKVFCGDNIRANLPVTFIRNIVYIVCVLWVQGGKTF